MTVTAEKAAQEKAAQETSNLPVPITQQHLQMMLKDIDTAGMSETDQMELVSALWEDYQKSVEATNYKPQRIRIVKEMKKFADSTGNLFDELKGVVVARQVTRWLKDKTNSKRPQCSSLDGKTGTWRNDDGSTEKKHCAGCPYGGKDAWGTATDEYGNKLAGKACKEMRRAYIEQPGTMFPSFISIPPTSLSEWDNFFSGRVNAGIGDLKAQVTLSLSAGSSGTFDYAVVNCKNGPMLKAQEILEFMKIKKQFEETLLGMDVEAEDYYPDGEHVGEHAQASPDNAEFQEPGNDAPTTEVYKGSVKDLPDAPAF